MFACFVSIIFLPKGLEGNGGEAEAGVSEQQESSKVTNIKHWKGKFSYYFDSLPTKLLETLDGTSGCSIRNGNIKVKSDLSTAVPTNPHHINIASFPPDPDMLRWWRGIDRPKQMRQEPLL